MRFSPLFLCLALLGLPWSPAEGDPVKVATVDMRRVFEGYHKSQEAEKRIDEMQASSKKELEERMQAYKRLVDQTNALTAELDKAQPNDPKTTEKLHARDEMLARVQQLNTEGQDFEVTRERQIAESTKRIRDGLIADITKVVQQQIQAGGYDLAFDRFGTTLNEQPLVMYARASYDITEEILTVLNQPKAEPAPATPAPAASPAPAAH